MPKKKEPKLVFVEWLDAYSSESGWKSAKKMRGQKPVRVKSVGWLVADEPDYITVAGTFIPSDGDGDGDVTIVRGMIKRIVEIGEPKLEPAN